MTALYIIGVILAVIAFFAIGYFLWSTAMENYGYNIFNLGVIIRGLLAGGCIFLGVMTLEEEPDSTLVFLIVAAVLWLWTFIATLIRTNFFIALFSVVYQVFAVFLVRSAINRLLK